RAGSVSKMNSMRMRPMTMKVQDTHDKRQQTEQESNGETDQIKISPRHQPHLPSSPLSSLSRLSSPSPVSSLCFLRETPCTPWLTLFRPERATRPHRLIQSLRQSRRVQDFSQQKQGLPCIFLPRQLDQHSAHFHVAGKLLRTLQQPDVKFPFGRSQIRSQFRVI